MEYISSPNASKPVVVPPKGSSSWGLSRGFDMVQLKRILLPPPAPVLRGK